MTPRKKTLLKLAGISVVLDLLTSLIEIPFLSAFLVSLPVKELIEQVVSTLIARHEIKLTFSDRLLGMLPIPGVTAVTVRVTKELFRHNGK